MLALPIPLQDSGWSTIFLTLASSASMVLANSESGALIDRMPHVAYYE